MTPFQFRGLTKRVTNFPEDTSHLTIPNDLLDSFCPVTNYTASIRTLYCKSIGVKISKEGKVGLVKTMFISDKIMPGILIRINC
jgi:hypothetical protein